LTWLKLRQLWLLVAVKAYCNPRNAAQNAHPIVVMNPIESRDDAIARVSSGPYGRFWEPLDHYFRSFHVETPVGGLKCKGYGHKGGSEGLDNYMGIKNVRHSSKIM
jgi:hypothetical protein